MTNTTPSQPTDTYEPDNVRDVAVRLDDVEDDEDRAIRALYAKDGELGEEDELSDEEDEDESDVEGAAVPTRADDFDSEEKVRLMASAADAVRASDIMALDLRELTIVTDFFLICTGKSSIQIRAIADRIEERLREQGLRKLRIEGYQEATWILMDYGDVVAHIMAEEQRAFYHLEEFWSSAPELELELVEEPASAVPSYASFGSRF